MASLRDVRSYASSGKVPIYEKSGRLCTVPLQEVQSSLYATDGYPSINLGSEIFNTSVQSDDFAADSYRDVMIPVNEGVLKRITRTFFEHGLLDALEEARQASSRASNPVVATAAECALRGVHFFNAVKGKLFPHTVEQGPSAIARFSETRDWKHSFIRCIGWHPNCFKVAIAGADDLIRVYTDEPGIVPVLKNSHQKWITALAWRPYSASELAVACQKGICLWTMGNTINLSPTSSQCVVLKQKNHCPITSIQWNPEGSLLASASISDTDILVWQVDKMQCVPVKRVGYPCSLLKWSPDGASLLSTTCGNVFRVWSVENKWKPERWCLPAGNIQSACWSPCGSFLLFVTSEDSLLYRVQLIEEQLFAISETSKKALPIADFSSICLNGQEVGGKPQALAWDPNGLYLAVTFQDTPHIAIFNTAIHKFDLSVSGNCYLSGIGSEYPSCVSFQSKNRFNQDSVLTIGWSSGRVQYFPFGKL